MEVETLIYYLHCA